MSEMTKEKALRAILLASRDGKPGALIHYAASYARVAFPMEGHEWQVQCLYILNNLSGWRGPEAREVRDFLKAQTKGMYGK